MNSNNNSNNDNNSSTNLLDKYQLLGYFQQMRNTILNILKELNHLYRNLDGVLHNYYIAYSGNDDDNEEEEIERKVEDWCDYQAEISMGK